MKLVILIVLCVFSFNGFGQSQFEKEYSLVEKSKIKNYYLKNQGSESPSKSSGTVSKGNLSNAKLIPFFGDNFAYFSSESYLAGRAFTSDKVKKIILNSYAELKTLRTNYHFRLMELSNKNGGKMMPHITHQNGMSVDFMMPMLQNGKPYIGLDSLGIDHYWLAFNNKGQYKRDTSISVDFDMIAQHILILNEQAKKQGMKISKVIIKIEYKEALYKTAYGKKLQESGIYLVKSLNTLINSLHDEHYHIDFTTI